jgi:hypothetical protein
LVDDRQRRIGENEVIFREVNEHVRGTNETFDVRVGEAEFVCECGLASCLERIRLPLADYERVRSEATDFLIVPGHELPEVETVVRQAPGYAVVRKNVGAAEELAIETDPRT